MARGYTQADDVTRTTTTSATYQNKIGVFLNSSQNNVLFMTCLLDNSVTNSDARVRLRDNSDGVDQLVFNIEAQDTTDVYSIAGFTLREGSGIFGIDKAYDLEYSSESGGTTGISDAYLCRMELVGTDKFSQNLTARSTTSATSANLCSVTCEAGNWLLLASGEINTTDTTPSTTLSFVLQDDATGTRIAQTGPPFVQDTTNYTPLWLAGYVSPTITKNYALKWVSDGTATLNARNMRLLALDLSQFKSYRIFYDPNNFTSAQTISNVPQTIAAELNANYVGDDYYLCIFACSNSGTATNSSQLLDFTLDTGSGEVILNSRTISREMNDVNEVYDMGGAIITNLKNKKATFRQRVYVETSGQSTTSKNNLIAVLQLGNTRLNRRTITIR